MWGMLISRRFRGTVGFRALSRFARARARARAREPRRRGTSDPPYAAATPSASSTDTHGTPTASATGAYVT
jgi:hypothetical protein